VIVVDEMVRAHVSVKGRVQAVGFRGHVEYHARLIGDLTGWVRNVGRDTVETIIEGERRKVDQLIDMIKKGPSISRVDECVVEWEGCSGEFQSFIVKGSIN